MKVSGAVAWGFLFLSFWVWAGTALGQTSKTYSTPGSGTFTVPDGVTSITIQVWGAGGGGGYNSNNNLPAAGGGGGGFSQTNIYAVTPGAIINYIIGAGGMRGSSTGPSTNGDNSTFGVITANGGLRGDILTGGLGGTASGGTLSFIGGRSPNSDDSNNQGGTGGGGGAGPGANGGDGITNSGETGGGGGTSPSNGIGGAGGNNNAAGGNGTSPGGGGGGEGGNGTNGGNGGNGQIIISWVCSNTLTSAAATSNQTTCVSSPITPITYAIAGANGATVSNLPTGINANYNSGILTVSGTPSVSGKFNYTVTPTGSCTSSTKTGTITVSANNTVSAPSTTPTLCINSSLPNIAHTTTGATGIGAASGLPAGVTANWASNTISISGTPTASGSFNYSIPLTGGCGTFNATGTIIVTPNNKVTVPSSTPTLCVNTVLGSITHTTTGATGIGAVSGLPAGINAAWAGDTITISGTPTASGTFNYTIPLTGGCNSPTVNATGTITVTPNNTVSAASSNETLCINTVITNITHTTTRATGIGASSGLPVGVTAAWAGNIITISGTPTSSGTFNYSIPLTGGCNTSPVNATGTITVTPNNTVSAPSSTETLCINVPLTAITHTTTGATGIGAASGLPAGITVTWVGNTITISGTPTVSGTFNYSIPLTGGCNTPAVSAAGTITVKPDNTVSAASSTETLCMNTPLSEITHSTTGATGITDEGIASANGLPDGVSASWSGGIITISGTPTASGTFNYSIPMTGGCGAVNATGTITVNPFATVDPTSVPFPSVCISSPTITPFTQQTSGVTGIGIPIGLPNGISASFDSNTGLITFSGTATTPTVGPQTYSIPLVGNCINGLAATGTIEVSPEYVLTSVNSVSATTIGGSATVTIYGDPTILSNGTYEVEYEIAEGSGSFTQEGPVNVSVVNGKGSVLTIPINDNTETYTVKILTIKKTTDQCTITLPDPPTTYFGICAAVFSVNNESEFSTFNVPANVFSITIEVYGGGGGGGNSGGAGGGAYSVRTNIPVTPGEPLGVFVGQGGVRGGENGVASYVTRNSNIADQLGNSLVYANGGLGNGNGGTYDSRYSGEDGNNANGVNGGDAGGPLGNQTGGQTRANGKSPGGGGTKSQGQDGDGGNGLVVISYSCPDADDTDCIKIIDDGTKSGTTVIEYICDDTWVAPEGLVDFTVIVGSGGGGGGSGFGSGGGGSGALIKQSFFTSNPYGFPAGTAFPIIVGEGGPGALAGNTSGKNGDPSSFSGSIDGNSINIIVQGGGGGGSQSLNPGANGASGGGGGAQPNPNGALGPGGNSIPITYTGTNVTLYQGNPGGSGDFNSTQNAIAGGGGGGLIPWIQADRPDGKAAGAGQGEGGNGGKGVSLTMGDSIRYYGAGGGGIGEYFNGTEKVGIGGSADEVKIGGDGNLSSPSAVGGQGVDKTGSGGGAGYGGGGKGGKGVVYIYYFNYRILEVEYLYFEAKYNSSARSVELTWATSQEWENSHFEIERAVNDVRTWTKVGEVKGQGYKDSPTSYTFEDNDIPASGGDIFYRLKQLDIDGSYSYSVTRSIQVTGLKGKSNWIVYPNPSSPENYVTVDLLDRSIFKDEQILIKISDVKGVFQSYTLVSIEDVTVAVNKYLDQAAPGIHIVQLIWGDHSEQLKILIR